MRDDEVAAEAMGINTTKYKVVAFVIGAFFAGVAGGLFAHTTTYINPAGFDFQRSIEVVVIVILGGMGNTAGVAFAAVLLTVLAEYLRFVAGYTFLPDWLRKLAANRTIIYALVLIALMLLRPQGLFGGIRAFGGAAAPVRPSPQPDPKMAALLNLNHCTVQFGGLKAVSDLGHADRRPRSDRSHRSQRRG